MHRHLPTAVVAVALVAAATPGCSNETPAQASQASSVSALRSSTAAPPTLTPQTSGTSKGLIAVSPVDSRVVWVSGRDGSYSVTTDGGNTWRAGVVAGAEALQFRDVEGVSEKVAYLLSIGGGTDSRIYKTLNGGTTWSLQFMNQDPDAFFDCFAFWTPTRGIAFSDSVNGHFPARRTTDGNSWRDIGHNLPPALPGESGFASSGTCVATQGENRAWIGTGGAAPFARILATKDGGNRWEAHDTPLRGSPSAGIFSVEFRDASHGVVGGGDLDPKAPPFKNFARSSDGGKTWSLTKANAQIGTVFGLAYARERGDDEEDDHSSQVGRSPPKVLVTGPGGAAWSPDEGDSWQTLDGVSGFWAVAFANERTGWLVGTDGRILKISFGDGD
jgi:photosystem II stability/assembly factor-like uncharacterized protein